MKSIQLQNLKNKLKNLLKNKEVSDLILFGSYIKGKKDYEDIDLAIISDKKLDIKIEGFHITWLSPKELIEKYPLMMNTFLKEGYSLKNNCSISQYFRFNNRVLISYNLKNLNASEKVKIVNILHGKNKAKGMVEEHNGKWIANQVFTIPLESSSIFEQFLLNFKIKFERSYILIH